MVKNEKVCSRTNQYFHWGQTWEFERSIYICMYTHKERRVGWLIRLHILLRLILTWHNMAWLSWNCSRWSPSFLFDLLQTRVGWCSSRRSEPEGKQEVESITWQLDINNSLAFPSFFCFLSRGGWCNVVVRRAPWLLCPSQVVANLFGTITQSVYPFQSIR